MNSKGVFKQLISNIVIALLVLAISSSLFIIGHDSSDHYYALCGVLLFWFYGMAFGLLNLNKLYGYTIMNFMLFVFFLSRPTISVFYETGWYNWEKWILEEALLLVFISEIALFFGAFAVKQTSKPDLLQIKRSPNYCQAVQTALLVIVLISSVLCAYSTLKNYHHYASLAYEELYISGGSNDNALIRAAVTIFPYAVFAYLASMPSKKKSIVVLGIYVALGIPTFLLGNRASLVLRIAFVVAYFFIRDYTNGLDGKRWINKRLAISFLVFVLAFVVFLGAFNYYRAGLDPDNEAKMPMILDFFYNQGTTFDTVCQGIKYQSDIMKLPQTTGYSIGPVFDTVVHSTLSQKLFGATSLGSGNSINMVMNGNSLAHKLSYIAIGEASYLSGHGRGSSYLLELFYDGGTVLVVLFSFVLGGYLASINRFIRKSNWFINTLVITSLARVFYIPRSSAFDFAAFLFTPHFWLIIGVILAVLFFDSALDYHSVKAFPRNGFFNNNN